MGCILVEFPCFQLKLEPRPRRRSWSRSVFGVLDREAVFIISFIVERSPYNFTLSSGSSLLYLLYWHWLVHWRIVAICDATIPFPSLLLLLLTIFPWRNKRETLVISVLFYSIKVEWNCGVGMVFQQRKRGRGRGRGRDALSPSSFYFSEGKTHTHTEKNEVNCIEWMNGFLLVGGKGRKNCFLYFLIYCPNMVLFYSIQSYLGGKNRI